MVKIKKNIFKKYTTFIVAIRNQEVYTIQKVKNYFKKRRNQLQSCWIQ